MIVLHQEAGEWPQQHFAFTVSLEHLDAAVASLREQGVEVTEPITHDWMNARSAYFEDPDGNALEFCAPNT
jgi:catechol 2,3-dioxygenase-like lactoylglutathione lyase family enzyme